mmetsp:Transcript_28464/g.59424  ORF Transcript_28464/g.59424 Transcript_28464/m.59424 type:complete len:328 (+) Transcript_28464:1-984(+)
MASSSSNTVIPKLHRPIFDGLTTPQEKMAVAMKEYTSLKDADADGLDFANKTSMWIAYERDIESQRPDRLFNDPLAKHFWQPYGKRLSDAMSFGLAISCFDPPPEAGGGPEKIGLELEGHVMYTAARTKLVNNQIDVWLSAVEAGQVLNLGSGLDTRPYWLGCLEKAKSYWEIDTASVMTHKKKVLDSLEEGGELPNVLCPVLKTIPMDFSEESIVDLPTKHGFDSKIPTCWILEGLIMYLKRPDVEDLIDTISTLSASTSMMILNFSTNMPKTTSPSIDELDERLVARKWTKGPRLMFGEEGFNFGRYPDHKPANKMLGFAMYTKD